jgi:hypothetical protein
MTYHFRKATNSENPQIYHHTTGIASKKRRQQNQWQDKMGNPEVIK